MLGNKLFWDFKHASWFKLLASIGRHPRFVMVAPLGVVLQQALCASN